MGGGGGRGGEGGGGGGVNMRSYGEEKGRVQVGHHLSAALTRTNISLSPSSFAAGNDLSRFCSAAPLAHFFFGSIGLHFLTQVGAEEEEKKSMLLYLAQGNAHCWVWRSWRDRVAVSK